MNEYVLEFDLICVLFGWEVWVEGRLFVVWVGRNYGVFWGGLVISCRCFILFYVLVNDFYKDGCNLVFFIFYY